MKKVSIVIPAYNEEGNISEIIKKIEAIVASLPYLYEIIFINDGSTDRTLEAIQSCAKENKHIFYIELSRNFGHQNALKAGIDHAEGDCVISMDGDMQHPPFLIADMLEKWTEGYDVVYTRRKQDKRLPFLKRLTSKGFYFICNKLSDIKIEDGTADFRLMDKSVATVFSSLAETDLFIRGMVKWLGFKQYAIDYEPNERFSGKTKYNFRKMGSLALKGITSFSVSPLYAAIYIGFIMSLLSFLYLPYVLYSYLTGASALGWASVILTIVFFGGIQLIILGILGIYIGKLFLQSKKRPNYIVRTTNLL